MFLVSKLFLTFIIVVLHSNPLNRIGIDIPNSYLLVHSIEVFAQIGVPMFFFISAILFYKSLSAIANEITGTRWNGKKFFGITK